MKFFKDTMAYKFVCLLERLQVEHKYLNIFKYILKLIKMNKQIKKKIDKKGHIDEKIELLYDLFKERLYLETIRDAYEFTGDSEVKYNTINNIIISEIIYTNFKLYIEYTIISNDCNIYVLDNRTNRGLNMSPERLATKENYDVCITILHLLQSEINVILTDILLGVMKRMKEINHV